MTSNSPHFPSLRARRAAGWALLIVAVLSVIGMLHHPTAHGHDAGELMRGMLRVGGLNAWVHGSLIALMLLATWAMLEFSLQRGLHRAAVRAAWGLYTLGSIAMVVAALTNGIVTTKLAAQFAVADVATQAQVQPLFALTWAINQTAAEFAVVVQAVAIALWSLGLVRERGMALALGTIGLTFALICVLALGAGRLTLDVHGMLSVVIGQSVWHAVAGFWLIRQR
jgi:hypothetical protein